MTEATLSIEDNPNPDDLQKVWDMLIAHNAAQAGPANFQKICILARDTNNHIIGGMNGYTFWNWLYVENLAVLESQRGQNLGSKILKAAEAEARRRGCTAAYLDTFSFQALPFYEKQGYRIFGTLYDFPNGHHKYFVTKQL